MRVPATKFIFALSALLSLPASAEEQNNVLNEVTVTGIREQQSRAKTPASIGVISKNKIKQTQPGHPSEIMEQVPGVHVNVTGGEGHMTAIRQPISTNPLYLYLEDGVATRSTGFFNHNALYEVNLPQSGGIEVLKGPGTALYGSDAIGGVINVLTNPAPLKPEADASLETGSFGWRRLLLSGGNTFDDLGLRGDLNITHTDGWRNATNYDRHSETIRIDSILDTGSNLKTVFTVSDINQQTAGSSTLSTSDYLNNPTLNYTPISYRKVKAFRASSTYEKEGEQTLFSAIPYVRYNNMEMLPNWMLSYDPVIYESGHSSAGMLIKYRKDFAPMKTRVIIGTDIDYSPGGRLEKEILPVKAGSTYTDYALTGTTWYDYDATFQSMSPYLHIEASPSDRLKLQAGLRYDAMRYDYVNHLSVDQSGTSKHRRPADTQVNFQHLSPKLGATYAFSKNLNGFASYRHAFRAPSAGQLFRQGQALNTVGLKPVKADSFELGLRGHSGKDMSWEASVYHMHKRDDILSYRDTTANTRETVNAGKTLHQGIETGFKKKLSPLWNLNLAYSYAKHTYVDWVVTSAGKSFSGNEMSSAPRHIGNARLAYKPAMLNGGRAELEWVHLGSYWMDDENTTQYPGHDVFNLRVNYQQGKNLNWSFRVINLLDSRYATRASYTAFKGQQYAPGMPRTYYVGMNYKFL